MSQGNSVEQCFRVTITHPMLQNEVVGVTGDCESLGQWRLERAHILSPEDDSRSVWVARIKVPSDRPVIYRYLVGFVDQEHEHLHVRHWETHITPRTVDAGATVLDTFGLVDGQVKIERGWLTRETMFQFKFFNNPFKLKNRMTNRLLYIKLTPQNLRENFESRPTSGTSFDTSLSNDTRGDEEAGDHSSYFFTEVATLSNANFEFHSQQQFGTPYKRDDYVLFTVTVNDADNIAYLVDLYTYSSKAAANDPPHHLGYHYILPTFLKNSDGKLDLGITSPSTNRLLGMMNIEYVKITPLPENACTLQTSFSRHWNLAWTGLDVGHRGSGTSFKALDGNIIRENTIASLKKAGLSGADMVEFDVQLSKDLVPVIYHDFHVHVSLKRKKTSEKFDMLELPMRDLTLEQLKTLKVYHVVEGRSGQPRFFDEELEEHQPFPTLSEAMDVIDEKIGFNIEVKSSMELFDGSKEADIVVDKNFYVNRILDVVLSKPITRRIVFSSFDPDVCTMLRYKQNLYPVMFLTLGITARYPSYHDPRCNTIEAAVRNACAMEFLGIVAHTEDLLRDESQIAYAKKQNLIVFCWGDDNNSKETIHRLKQLGLHAIIYDKMHVLSDKSREENIFMVGGQACQGDLLEIEQMDLQAKSTAANLASKKRKHAAEAADAASHSSAVN